VEQGHGALENGFGSKSAPSRVLWKLTGQARDEVRGLNHKLGRPRLEFEATGGTRHKSFVSFFLFNSGPHFIPMKKLLIVVALAAVSMAFLRCAAITKVVRSHSFTYIDAGKLFVLGGGQPGAFTLSGKNVGPVPVTVRERRADGSVRERGTLAQGQQTQLDFPDGSAALLLNPSTKLAVLSLDISRIRGLGMRYEKLK